MPDTVTAPGAALLRRSPLYGWWQRHLVGSVDHEAVLSRIFDEGCLSPRFAFMTTMSAGIAVLGLLLSSPAVVIGAMLISPLMGPILGIGFALAVFDFRALRRALTAFAAGSAFAVLFTALVVLCSPLKDATPEILARTRPNLFDLLVALFAALAGSFAIIRSRGDTIVGVAIATALMPPLAVVGFGIATANLPVLSGALALFVTNFLTIALSGTIMARLYGFGSALSAQQSWTQTGLLLLSFVVMAVPLGLALNQIAREAVTVNQIRAELGTRFGPEARVTQLDVAFDRDPWAVRAVVIASRDKAADPRELRAAIEKRTGRSLALQVDQILIDPREGPAKREALARANAAAADDVRDQSRDVARVVAALAGVPEDQVTIDRDHQRVVAAAAPIPDAGLASYEALEKRAGASAPGWLVEITPPPLPLPPLRVDAREGTLSPEAQAAARLSAWASKRWNRRTLAVPGLTDSPPEEGSGEPAPPAAQRALAIAAILQAEGVEARAAPPAGNVFTLQPPASR